MRVGSGGGLADEGEDIEVLEVTIVLGVGDDARDPAAVIAANARETITALLQYGRG